MMSAVSVKKGLGLLLAILATAAILVPNPVVLRAAADAADASATAVSGGELRDEINGLNQDVQKKKADLQALNSKIESYLGLVTQKKAETASLEDDIALLDNRLAQEQLAIDIAQEEIKSIELEIGILDRQVADESTQMAGEQVLLGGLVRKLYRSQFDKSTLEILLTKSSLSDFFDDLYALASLQTAVDAALDRVKTLRVDLQAEKAARETKHQDSLDRKRTLEVAKLELEDERALKNEIMEETRSSELQYRYLLADLKNEQGNADSEITYLEKALRQKMDLSDRLADANAVLSWPVVPTRGLSATFHDPDYPFRYVFEHPAVDIRCGQGTPVRAAAGGVVARAKNAGMGYSYVMLLHSNDLATVYGHLSKITAKEDTYVERGEIIGYSGGMPGTPGAGRLTTGPHLHFEVRLAGLPVDPMKYLLAF